MNGAKGLWQRLLAGMLLFAVITMIGSLSNLIKYGGETTQPETDNSTVLIFAPDVLTTETLQWGTMSGFYMGDAFNNLPVQYSMVNGYPIIEGDIIVRLDEDDPIIAGTGLPKTMDKYYWNNNLVAYDIHPNLPDTFRITDAIAHWEEHTSIRFVERTDANASQYKNYIRFQPGMGCSSYVGMIGGRQPINLARACTTGNTIHEIGHALGLWHEQSRHDRDEHVTIHYENIMRGVERNFDMRGDDGVDIGDYDYGSLMHYPRWAFSKNGKDTIVPVIDDAEIGQRDGLSAGDIAAIEYIYGR